MSFQLSAADLNLLLKICRETPFMKDRKVWVFGSRARGDARENSDLDLLLGEGMSLADLGQLREIFEESDLSVKVDLVRAEDLAATYLDRVRLEMRLLGV